MDATELQPSLAASIGASEHSTASSSAAATASVSAAATASVAKAKKARKVIRKGAFQVAVWNFPCVSGGKDGKDSQVSFYLFFCFIYFSSYFQIFNLFSNFQFNFCGVGFWNPSSRTTRNSFQHSIEKSQKIKVKTGE